MLPRLNYRQVAPQLLAGLSAFSGGLATSFPDAKLKALVELRVSQINGCAYCCDLHSREARQHGEDQQRLDCLPVWREVDFFTPRECAALAWAESLTLIAQTHAPDADFQEVAAHFTEPELVQLTVVIGTMNLWNRVAIGFRNAPARRKPAPKADSRRKRPVRR